jgi:opacity protein-like surface antigen
MKKVLFSTIVLTGFLAASLRAGTETYKQVAPPPPPMYGLGFYGAIDMGANVFQNRGDDRTFSNNGLGISTADFGDTLTVSPKNDVGFYGGIKLGYVFGTGVVRPTVEGDFFYNGFEGGADFSLRDRFGNTLAQRDVSAWINTGAFMANFILRFAPGNQRFQPYAGAGVGIYYAESSGTEVVNPVTGVVPINTGGGQSHADLAWQVVAGSDYLDYTSTQINTRENRDLGQHLVGAGVRFFFH